MGRLLVFVSAASDIKDNEIREELEEFSSFSLIHIKDSYPWS